MEKDYAKKQLEWIKKNNIRAGSKLTVERKVSDEESGRAVVVDSKYYLQDSSSYLGNDILWWAKDSNGYTTDLSKAHIFTKEEAINHHNARISDIPWPKEYIDARTRPTVDVQYTNIKDALRDTDIKIQKPELPKKKTLRCDQCGKFVSANDYYISVYAGNPCPHCP